MVYKTNRYSWLNRANILLISTPCEEIINRKNTTISHIIGREVNDKRIILSILNLSGPARCSICVMIVSEAVIMIGKAKKTCSRHSNWLGQTVSYDAKYG